MRNNQLQSKSKIRRNYSGELVLESVNNLLGRKTSEEREKWEKIAVFSKALFKDGGYNEEFSRTLTTVFLAVRRRELTGSEIKKVKALISRLKRVIREITPFERLLGNGHFFSMENVCKDTIKHMESTLDDFKNENLQKTQMRVRYLDLRKLTESLEPYFRDKRLPAFAFDNATKKKFNDSILENNSMTPLRYIIVLMDLFGEKVKTEDSFRKILERETKTPRSALIDSENFPEVCEFFVNFVSRY